MPNPHDLARSVVRLVNVGKKADEENDPQRASAAYALAAQQALAIAWVYADGKMPPHLHGSQRERIAEAQRYLGALIDPRFNGRERASADGGLFQPLTLDAVKTAARRYQ